MTAYFVKKISHYCNISVNRCTQIPQTVISYYDLTFVLKGSMHYTVNGKSYVLNENDAILLPPGSKRQRAEGIQKVHYVSFNFQTFPECELPVPIFLENIITQDIRKLIAVFSQQHISPLYHSKEKLFNVLNYILFEILDAVDLKSNHPEVKKIRKFIDENVSKKITLQMLGDHVHLSKEYVAYIFKKNVGKTVIEYVNERKMMLAKNMIKNEKMSLKDVAENLGYENYGYFSRVFKKHFNTTPIQFKNSNDQGE